MRKFFLSLAALAALALAGLLAFAATRPDTFRFERSTTIGASPAQIRPLIDDMKRFNSWNPYAQKVPASKASYRGPAAGPGATYDFEGDEVGKGTIRIVEPSGPDVVSMQLDMQEPMATRNHIDFRLEPQASGTRVTWSMHGPTPYVAKVLHVLFDMDAMMARDFDAGLASLKALAEGRS